MDEEAIDAIVRKAIAEERTRITNWIDGQKRNVENAYLYPYASITALTVLDDVRRFIASPEVEKPEVQP